MEGQTLNITLASLFSTLAMLTLAKILIAIVFTHQMANNQSTYSSGEGIPLPLESAYHINYSRTRLAFIASFWSKLSTLLISSAMTLSSYPRALSLAQSSDLHRVPKLPSPYQLDLLIKLIDTRLIALWSFVFYTIEYK